MLILDDVSLTPSRALTQATEPADTPCREPTEEQVLEMRRNKAEYTAKFAELQASYTKDPETYAAARAEAEENRRLAEQLTDEIEQYKYEQWSEQFDVCQQKYEARQAAKQKVLDQCDYTLVDKLAEDDAGHIRSVGNRLVNLGRKLGVNVIMSFCQLDESSFLTFSEASTLEERRFIDTYKELVSITMTHYLQPRIQFAVESAEARDIPENESHAANLEDFVNPAAFLFDDPLPETIDSCTLIEKANDRGLTQSLCVPSWDSNSGNETEQGLWNTLKNIFSTHGLEIEFHFSPCTSLTPPVLSPLPLGNPEVAMQVSLIFAQLFALCWIRGFHIELHCLPSNPTCNPPTPPAPAQPFVLKSIPIQRGWWTDQVGIQKEAGALVDPIKFAGATSAGKRRWSPYPVMKSRSSFKTVLVR